MARLLFNNNIRAKCLAPTVAGPLDSRVQVLCLSRCLICTQKDGQTPAVSVEKQEDISW